MRFNPVVHQFVFGGTGAATHGLCIGARGRWRCAMRRLMPFLAIPVLALLLAGDVAAAEADSGSGAVLTGAAAFGNWQKDKPGTRRLIRPQDQPKPLVTGSASNGADEVKMPRGAKPV